MGVFLSAKMELLYHVYPFFRPYFLGISGIFPGTSLVRIPRHNCQVVTDQEGRAEAFKAFLERAKTGLVATGRQERPG